MRTKVLSRVRSQLRWGERVEETHGPGSRNRRRGRKETPRGLCPVGGEQNGGKDIRCPAEGSGLVLREPRNGFEQALM